MHIYLRHPVHGTKVAIAHAEAEMDEQNGWEVYDPFCDDDDFSDRIIENALREKRKYTRRVRATPAEGT
jgi:hypothetical protein